MPGCRDGRPEDADAIAEIIAGTAAQDPSCVYRCPFRHEFPRDFSDDCLRKARQYLDDLIVAVYEVPITRPDGSGAKRVIAFGCWNPVLPPGLDYRRFDAATIQSDPAPATKPPKRHAIPSRSQAFKDKCAAEKKELFDDRFRDGHMFLKALHCHPVYQGQGAGRALVNWGIRRARFLQIPVTLFASSMGKRLYDSLGFKTVSRFRVQADGDHEYLDVPAMVLFPIPPAPDIWGRTRVGSAVECVVYLG